MTRRRWISLLLVLATEGYLYFRYAEFGAEFHFWLHGLFGAALSLAALTLVRILRTRDHGDPARGAVAPWEAGWVRHIYSAVPDVLFLGFGVLHVLWMDVFAFHITLHFIPVPLVTMLVLFLLALAAYGLAVSRHPWYAVALLISGTGVLLAALALAAPSLAPSPTCTSTEASGSTRSEHTAETHVPRQTPVGQILACW